MSERSRNIIVGFTALVGIGGFIWLVMIFGQLPEWTRKSYPVHIFMDTAKGLAGGSRVKLNGVDVGEISNIKLMPDLTKGVDVTALILERFDVPKNSEVTASSGPLGGTATVEITPLPNTSGAPTGSLPKDGSKEARLVGHTADMGSVITRLEGQLHEQFENLNKLTSKIVEFADTYTAVGRDMKALVEQRSPSDVDAGKFTGNLSTVLTRADQRVAELKKALDGINSLMGDKELVEDIRATVKNARDLTGNANKLTGQASEKIDQLSRKVISTIDDLSKTLTDMDALVNDARAGKGTMGKLLQDPAMYDNFSDAAARFGDAIKDLRLLIQKWKAEGLPVQF